jgi:hypothetical protein
VYLSNPNGKEGGAMTLTVDLFISIISFGLSAFAIGYALGQSSNKTQK